MPIKVLAPTSNCMMIHFTPQLLESAIRKFHIFHWVAFLTFCRIPSPGRGGDSMEIAG